MYCAGYMQWYHRVQVASAAYASTGAAMAMTAFPVTIWLGGAVMYASQIRMIVGRAKIQRAIGVRPDDCATSALIYCCGCAPCAICQEARAVKKAWVANGCQDLKPLAAGDMER